MGFDTKYVEQEKTISDVFVTLLNRSHMTVEEVAHRADVPVNTLYTLKTRRTMRSDPKMLKRLAEVFGEDMSIFCGLDDYDPPTKLTPEEKELIDSYRQLTDPAKERANMMLSDIFENPKNRKKK